MSIKVIQAVWDHSASKGNDRLILLAIADRADHDGRGCWKGKERLAAMANCGRSTATDAIARLEELVGVLGVPELVVTRRAGKSSEYRVVLPGVGGQDLAGPDPGRGPESGPPGGQTGARPVGSPSSRDTSIDPSSDPNPSAGSSAPAPSEPFGGDPIKAKADEISRAFWERKDPKPLVPFVGIRKIVESALRAHWPPSTVAEGLDRCDAISRNSLERAMTKIRGQRPGQSPPRPAGPPARLDHSRLG